MTIEEKLQRFRQYTVENAKNKRSAMLSEYEAALEKDFLEHKEKKIRQAKLEIKAETESFRLSRNKELSRTQFHIKRKLSRKQAEIKEKIFAEVGELLSRYMQTSAYQDLLIRQITEAKAYAKEEEIVIYISSEDERKRQLLQKAAGTGLEVSEESFIGGIKAFIPARNILIDHSFESKLAEERENFTFSGLNGGSSNE